MSDWIDFEIWMDDVSVLGYMDDEEQELNWMSWDGLECYDDFSRTNAVGDIANTEDEARYLLKWCMIQDFLSKVDIREQLLNHKYESITVTYGDGLYNLFKIELYINSSKLDKYDEIIGEVIHILE